MTEADEKPIMAQNPFNTDQLLEVMGSPWPGQPVDYHRLFLFDRLQRGAHDWNFLIVTRRQGVERLELAAVAFELDSSGKVCTRLESRKASIPAPRLLEVIEGLLVRFDETSGEYTDYDLTGMTGSESPAAFLAELTGIPAGANIDSHESAVGLQPGHSNRQ